MIITEEQFRIKLKEKLDILHVNPRFVTGPGRSGAIASVYASYYLKIPYVPFKTILPNHFFPILIIDTVENTGKTLRSACKFYENNGPIPVFVFEEPPRLHFWYEGFQQ